MARERNGDKRKRLIEAATSLCHQQGFYKTTLAEIAAKSEVPLGNVYYYFRTKEEIAKAVIEVHAEQYHEFFTKAEQLKTPLARLEAWIDFTMGDLGSITQYGCPIGRLCQELNKEEGVLAELVASILQDSLQWCAKEFSALGLGNKAAVLAFDLGSRLQGICVLIHSFKDPKLAEPALKSAKTWLKTLIPVKAME